VTDVKITVASVDDSVSGPAERAGVEVGQGGYYGNVNSTLLDLIPPDIQKVCEFGCGAGALARAIRQKLNTPMHYVGVELMPDALLKAKSVLDVSVLCDLDAVRDWSADPELNLALPMSSFDLAIFGDVLEHLYDPLQVLRQAVQRLRLGGAVLGCIPNVQHWSVFAQLAIGRWPQSDEGLFDRTHVRWFTLTDMVALFNEAGLVVEKVVPRVFEADRGAAVMSHLRPLAQYLGIDSQDLVDRGLPLQYVLVGRKESF